MTPLKAFLVAAILGVGGCAKAEAAACPGGPKFFVFGVWVAPSTEMAKWRDRGVNTVIGVPQGWDVEAHDREARALGLKQIRPPRAKIDEDLAGGSLIAFMTRDEPSDIVGLLPRESPDQVTAEQKPWRAAMDRAGRCKPVFSNHIGDHIWQRNARIGLNLAEYHRRADWYGADKYQIRDGQPNLLIQDGYASTYQGHVLDLQSRMAPAAPLLSFVQTAPIDTRQPVPTPGELKTQIWSSVVHGASMIGLFPVQLAPSFAFDATPAPLVRTLQQEFKAIKAIEPMLIDPAAGGARRGKVFTSAPRGEAPKADQLPFPFEARVIDTDGGGYTVVVNLANEPATLTYAPWGVAGLGFQANDVKHGRGRSWAAARPGR